MIKQTQISPVSMTKKTISESGIEFTNYNQDWLQSRIGKVTASQAYKLCAKEGWGKEGWGYIRTRAYERLSKVSSEREIITQSMIDGLVEENHAMRVYMRKYNVPVGYFRVQKLIHGEDPLFSCTPDGIHIFGPGWLGSGEDKIEGWNCKLVEAKCYDAKNHMACIESEKPEDTKTIDVKAYWQALFQLVVSNTMDGSLLYFDQALKEDQGGFHEIQFNQVKQRPDVTFLKQRMADAKIEIDKIYNKWISKKV